MMRDLIVSLADMTGIMVEPWLRNGYRAILVDPQHPEGVTEDRGIIRVGRVLDHPETWDVLRWARTRAVFMAAFPVCTNLAVSGTAHWQRKRNADPDFQERSMQLVHECRVVGEMLGVPYFFENPVSAVSSIYRKPDFTFSPFEYGGYLPENDMHPIYPDYYPPRDAYGKKTCLWTGNGFRMPIKKPVMIAKEQNDGQGASRAHNKLGGSSDKTKNVRSATPRGFAEAVYLEHGDI